MRKVRMYSMGKGANERKERELTGVCLLRKVGEN